MGFLKQKWLKKPMERAFSPDEPVFGKGQPQLGSPLAGVRAAYGAASKTNTLLSLRKVAVETHPATQSITGEAHYLLQGDGNASTHSEFRISAIKHPN
jgi:hypothetical protein